MKNIKKLAAYKMQIKDLIRTFIGVQTEVALDGYGENVELENVELFIEYFRTLLSGKSNERESFIRGIMRDGLAPSILPKAITERLENDPLDVDRFSIDFFDGEKYLFTISSKEIDF